jgi:RNA polymerase sigma factor (TIGR02999 family)
MTEDVGMDVTAILDEARAGNPDAAWRALAMIYAEMRRAAARLMVGERAAHTLQPTALVNEVVVRLLGSEAVVQARDGPALCLAATHAMRQVLIDHARAKGRLKRGGGWKRTDLDSVPDLSRPAGHADLALQEALQDLAKLSQRQCDVVTLRFYAGMSVPETARALGVSVSTVESDFRIARAWLHNRFGEEGP